MEISENLGFMYGQIFKKYVQIAASIHPKSQKLFRLHIRPQKNPKFVYTGPKREGSYPSAVIK